MTHKDHGGALVADLNKHLEHSRQAIESAKSIPGAEPIQESARKILLMAERELQACSQSVQEGAPINARINGVAFQLQLLYGLTGISKQADFAEIGWRLRSLCLTIHESVVVVQSVSPEGARLAEQCFKSAASWVEKAADEVLRYESVARASLSLASSAIERAQEALLPDSYGVRLVAQLDAMR